MIILFTDKKDFKQSLLSKLDNPSVFTNLLDLQMFLSNKNNECTILMINISKFFHECKLFTDWLGKANPFIKNIILYYTDTSTINQCVDIVKELKRYRYDTKLISKKQLIAGLKNYES